MGCRILGGQVLARNSWPRRGADRVDNEGRALIPAFGSTPLTATAKTRPHGERRSAGYWTAQTGLVAGNGLGSNEAFPHLDFLLYDPVAQLVEQRTFNP